MTARILTIVFYASKLTSWTKIIYIWTAAKKQQQKTVLYYTSSLFKFAYNYYGL